MRPAASVRFASTLRSLISPGAVIVLAVACMAHVGSPNTFFAGHAGPYPVQVSVRLPGVIPGLAQIAIRLTDTSPDAVSRVTVQPIQWNVDANGAPPPDVALPVPGDPQLYASELWFMAPTSYRVHVVVQGRSGTGTAVIPVLALATAQRAMPRGMGWMLSALGLFLVVGLLTLIGAAVRESVVPPGTDVDARRRRRARIAVAVAAVLLTAAVIGGRAWWNAEALAYRESVLYRPFTSTASVSDGAVSRSGVPGEMRASAASEPPARGEQRGVPASDGGAAAGATKLSGQEKTRRVLTLTISDRRWPPPGNVLTRFNSLMPDHGKLMHMFLIREPAMNAFAHVHPVPRQPATAFDVELPPLPEGRYRVYGDIVHESGYAQTLTTSVDLGEPRSADGLVAADSDDSWFVGDAAEEAPSASFRAQDGTTITWERGIDPIAAGVERVLRFVVHDPNGDPAALEAYMGMNAHIVVAREDGTVFAHLHPFGSVSMAALQKFAQPLDRHAIHEPASRENEVSTLYAFPEPGRYRIWVQTKRSGRVVTAAFQAIVIGFRPGG